MNAGFLKRAISSLIDITIVFIIVYATFALFGRTLLRNQVPDFDEIFATYSEIIDVYNSDLALLQEEYNAQLELAGEDQLLIDEVKLNYQEKVNVLDEQNTVDIEPYNRPLTGYFISTIYYFTFGFLILMSIYAVATKGRTLGRTLLQIKLDGPVNVLSVFFHDIVLKYFFIVLVFVVSMYAGAILFLLSLIIDLGLMSFTRKRSTLRDILLKMSVVKAGYGY
ncbi:MAG: RDD family protein [Firmicutes bacterium]|nr:RDD family protein [Bacillota bacterium]